MRISILCQFEEATAAGVLMRGKGEALAALGQEVSLIHHPFKYEKRHPGEFRKINVGLDFHSIYSKFFGCRGKSKWLNLPVLIFRDVPRVYRLLVRSEIVLMHKALPLTFFYHGLLKLARYRGKVICILDDWEGIGGMATLRQPENILNKLIVSAAEEYMPIWSRGNLCNSRLLFQKMEMSKRTRGKSIYLPNGAAPRKKTGNREGAISKEGEFVVGYVGTFKSRRLVEFIDEMVSETLKRDSHVRFLFIGGGERFEDLRLRVSMKEGVMLKGQIPHAQVLENLESINLCLLYLNDEFPEYYIDASRSSTKMFEYMAMGKPILASRFGEPAHLLREGCTGWLVENHPRAFAEQILQAKSHLQECDKMGKRLCSEFEERYTHAVLMKEFLNWVQYLR